MVGSKTGVLFQFRIALFAVPCSCPNPAWFWHYNVSRASLVNHPKVICGGTKHADHI